MPTRGLRKGAPPMKSSVDGHHSDELDSNEASQTVDRGSAVPALDSLISALEQSPPANKTGRSEDEAVSASTTGTRKGANVSASMARGVVRAPENFTDTTAEIIKEYDIKLPADARKKAALDDNTSRRKRKRTPMDKQAPPIPTEPSSRTLEDFKNTIDEAICEHRIDEKKGARLRECLQAGDWSQIAYNFMCENIPLKRNGKGYSCRVCEVPKKGHRCPYCHVCSTPAKKYRADDKHKCINCITCFNVGKKGKKLVQIECKGHACPHGAT